MHNRYCGTFFQSRTLSDKHERRALASGSGNAVPRSPFDKNEAQALTEHPTWQSPIKKRRPKRS